MPSPIISSVAVVIFVFALGGSYWVGRTTAPGPSLTAEQCLSHMTPGEIERGQADINAANRPVGAGTSLNATP